MVFSLHTEQNPLLRLYELFAHPGVRPIDDPTHLGVKSLDLSDAEEVIRLVRQLRAVPVAALRVGELRRSGRLLINFAATSLTDWLDEETLQLLSDEGQLCADSFSALNDWLLALQVYQDGADWPGTNPEDDLLELLPALVSCQNCVGQLTLDAVCDKTALIKEYLLNAAPGIVEKVSAQIWHSPAAIIQGFRTFDSFLSFCGDEAELPLVIFFYQELPAYAGDYCKIIALAGPLENLTAREQQIAQWLAELVPQTFLEYELIRRRHQHESRSNTGERFDLPPALWLTHQEGLASYPAHPLFESGPLRSLLVYAVMSWLAETTVTQQSITRFTLPVTDADSRDLSVVFTLSDAQVGGASIFATAHDWRGTLALTAHEINVCAGSDIYRSYWADAVGSHALADFAADKLFPTLAEVYAGFVKRKMQTPVIADQLADLDSDVVELRVFLDKVRKEIVYTIHSSNNAYGFFHHAAGSFQLNDSNPETKFVELNKLARIYLQRLEEAVDTRHVTLAGHTPQSPQLPSRIRLAEMGLELWATLIPEKLKRAYNTIRNQQNINLFIVSDDPSFPWELVKPFEPEESDIAPPGFDDQWWSLHFGISRWLTGSAPPAKEIALNRICCVVSGEDLPSARREREFFQSLGVQVDLPRSRDELLEMLSTRGYDVLHFACHGNFNQRQPVESEILLPGGASLTPGQLAYNKGIRTLMPQHRPLVFLNACHSGRTGGTLVGLEGWASQIISQLKCGAFIGCGWEVNDPLAADFAIAFYTNFKNGQSLGKSVQAARRLIMEKDDKNSTGLAYYLYGDPHCRLKK